MNPRTPALAFTSIALLAVLAACAPQPEIAPTTTPSPASDTEPASTPSPEPTPSDAAEEPAADPTCETLIAPSTIEIFEEHGWTYREDEFRVGPDVIEGGLQCVWGDYTVASDHVQVFGWAPLPADESAAAQQKLLSEGWARADKDDHTYITEDPQFAIAVDEAGYGMTYEFGDGWVTLADTMQSLVLIERP